MILNFLEFHELFDFIQPRTPGPSSNINHDETAREAALVKDHEVQRGKRTVGMRYKVAPTIVLNGVLGPLQMAL